MTGRRTKSTITVAIAIFVFAAATAVASWVASGSGNAYSKSYSVDAGNQPTATVSNRSVTVNWTATGGSVPVTGYTVKRYNTSGVEQTIGSNCSGTVSATTCTENAVPAGTWRYTVTPSRQNWTGSESGQSTAVTVNAPNLSLTPANVTSLPQNLTGQVTNFVPGQTVTFRLDNQTTGTVLSGTVTPSTIPANGTSSVSVTLPSGVTNGAHTIYAIGSGSDVASANVTVALPTSTFTTAAFDIRDASSGTEVNQSSGVAFASDSKTMNTGTWATAFSGTRFVDYDLNSPLRDASTVNSGNITIRLATNSASSAQGCFYVEARSRTDNTLYTTYGSAGTPYCTTAAQTQTTFTIPIGGSTTGEMANDVRFRIYGRTSGVATTFAVDQVNLSVATNDGNFTLYPDSVSDAATGGATTTTPWSQTLDDNIVFTDAAGWTTAYATTRYFRATFPGYVPTGATIQSATLTHAYRVNTASRQVCNYVEVLAGSTVIATRGSSTSDLSCSSANTTDVIDTINLPEVDTVAEANSLSAKVYMKRSAAGATAARHDQTQLSITYTK